MPAFLRSLGWKPITPENYSDTWQRYGGSVITHPEVLAFIQQRVDCHHRYLGRFSASGRLEAAIATWGPYLAGDKTALGRLGVEQQFDLGSPELILPLGPAFRGLVPFRGKYVSALHSGAVRNITARNNRRSICLAKGLGSVGMSSRHKSRRRSQLNHLLREGGALHPVEQISVGELTKIYAELFAKRWHRPLPCLPRLHEMLSALRTHLTGHVLTINDQPAAFQLLLAASSARSYSVEYINGGVDPRFYELSPGTVLTWANIEQSWNLAQQHGLECRYSFGRNSAEYKAQWANESPLMRMISW